ncbi:hypothetical protein [Sphingomonas bacterium]|uniref:hypothetical protein n=1 Tax=Sphingomonas bacterium TaxID=1895847 RepID=UPI001575B9B6|nr:hypothetical protein [Sphingomonas bacterium]
MSGNADMLALARVDIAPSPLLQNTSFEGFGSDAYGKEEIAAMLRRHSPFTAVTRQARTARSQAVIGEDAAGRPVALFADLHDGWITRLWRLGEGADPAPLRPVTSVPADADMDQRGGRLGFAPEAHPELEPAHAAALVALGDRWLAGQPVDVIGALACARPIILRAFSEGGACAALIRIQGRFPHGLGGFLMLVMIADGETIVLADQDGRAAAERQPWRPALR